jgi:hypothetical protein
MKRLMAKTLAALTTASSFAALTLAPASAEAGRYHWRPRVGVYIGAPLLPYYYHPRPYYPSYYYPYYHPPVVVREQPVTYIEQTPPVVVAPAPAAPGAPPAGPTAQTQQQYWYYCQDTQTYYPHAQTCASPWQRVIPHPPQQP